MKKMFPILTAFTLLTSVTSFAEGGKPFIQFCECTLNRPAKAGAFAPSRFKLFIRASDNRLLIAGSVGEVLGEDLFYAVSGRNLDSHGNFVLKPAPSESYANESYLIAMDWDHSQVTAQVSVGGEVTGTYDCR